METSSSRSEYIAHFEINCISTVISIIVVLEDHIVPILLSSQLGSVAIAKSQAVGETLLARLGL